MSDRKKRKGEGHSLPRLVSRRFVWTVSDEQHGSIKGAQPTLKLAREMVRANVKYYPTGTKFEILREDVHVVDCTAANVQAQGIDTHE